MNNYYSINETKIIDKYNDFYDDPEFNINTAGARLLGNDMSQILNGSNITQNKFIASLEQEYNLQEESRFLYQILETNRQFNFDELYKCLEYIITELKNN